jgi:hypothetical protein
MYFPIAVSSFQAVNHQHEVKPGEIKAFPWFHDLSGKNQ